MTIPDREPNVQQEESAWLSCLGQDEQGLFEEQGSLRIEGGPAALASSRGQLFQVAALSKDVYRVRRFTPPKKCPGTLIAADSEHLVKVRAQTELTRTGWAFAVDPEKPELLLGDVRYQTTTASASLSLAWFSGESLDDVASGELSGTTDQFTAMALAHGRALVIENNRQLYLLEREGNHIATRAHVDLSQTDHPVDVSRILSFNEDMVYLSMSSQPVGVLVLRTTDLSMIARYETPSIVHSIAFSKEGLLLGMNNALVLAEPVCAPPP